MSVNILGIESSCDDTSAAVISDGCLRSNVIASQKVHEAYGGVVPELASRAHQQNIVPVVSEALRQAGIDKSEVTAIAFTRGPGLLGSLLVGTSFAKGMAVGLDIPLVDVNHLHAHILSHFIRKQPEDPVPDFPFMCLLVSGGNSQIVVARSPYDMEIVGKTIDDAAGEAFDKCAKVMGLPYPGGPHIDRLAAIRKLSGSANHISRASTILSADSRHRSCILSATISGKIRISSAITRLISRLPCRPLSSTSSWTSSGRPSTDIRWNT